MITAQSFRALALSFSGTIEQPHFERTSFRANKKIFATLDVKNNLACLMLYEIQQNVFCAFNTTVIYPVPNKWGKQEATYVDLKSVRKNILKVSLTQAYNKTTTKKKK